MHDQCLHAAFGLCQVTHTMYSASKSVVVATWEAVLHHAQYCTSLNRAIQIVQARRVLMAMRCQARNSTKKKPRSCGAWIHAAVRNSAP